MEAVFQPVLDQEPLRSFLLLGHKPPYKKRVETVATVYGAFLCTGVRHARATDPNLAHLGPGEWLLWEVGFKHQFLEPVTLGTTHFAKGTGAVLKLTPAGQEHMSGMMMPDADGTHRPLLNVVSNRVVQMLLGSDAQLNRFFSTA